jgi:hypothetical protein
MHSLFTQPEFIAALYQKLCDLRAGAKSSDDGSLSSALHFYRYWSAERTPLKEMLEGTQGELRKKLEEILQINDARFQECEKLLSAETLRIFRTDDLPAFRRLSAVFIRNARREGATYKRRNWSECYCAVILQLLIKGNVPAKKEVREAALHEMAIRELPPGPGEQAISAKIKALRKDGPKRPSRIFDELGCAGLPEAISRPGEAYRH